MRLVRGVGINDADYVTRITKTIGYVDGKQKRKLVWSCPFYTAWVHILEHGYSENWKEKYQTYATCTVWEGWHLFSTFKAWMETQDWEGKQLDKDVLFPGNKVYSPETCVFVTRQVNVFLTDCGASRGKYSIGVSWDKQKSKLLALCSNPFTKKQEFLGYFSSELEAHKAWLKRKLEHAYALAAIQTDERVAKALVERYENYPVVVDKNYSVAYALISTV